MQSTSNFYRNLTNQEISNPISTFLDAFDAIDLEGFKQFMWIGFRALVTDSYQSLPTQEKVMIFEIYEILERMVEAGHLLVYKNK